MTRQPAVLLVSLAVLCSPAPVTAASQTRPGSRILLAQAADAAGPTDPTAVPSDAGTNTGTPGTAASAVGSSPSTPTPNGAASTKGAPAAGSAAIPPASHNSAGTMSRRNGSAALPTLTQQGPSGSNVGSPSITFGGPQVDVQPIYGSTLRDNGAGNDGVPIYGSAPTTLGGPINGTANPYYATLPNGAGSPGQTTSTSRNTAPNGNSSATQQPLGARPYTRDQGGTFGGTASGYDAQGTYNGTAAQTGVGYGSPYAGNGRPSGGLLSTGVDATGPLHPYIPLNNSPIGRPNSGYGIPNGARSTHMDGRGVQRLD